MLKGQCLCIVGVGWFFILVLHLTKFKNCSLTVGISDHFLKLTFSIKDSIGNPSCHEEIEDIFCFFCLVDPLSIIQRLLSTLEFSFLRTFICFPRRLWGQQAQARTAALRWELAKFWSLPRSQASLGPAARPVSCLQKATVPNSYVLSSKDHADSGGLKKTSLHVVQGRVFL